MHSRRNRILFCLAAVLSLLVVGVAWALFDPPPPKSTPGQTNLIASCVVQRPLAEVRAAIQFYCSGTNGGATATKTLAVPGESYSTVFVDCQPPPPKCSVPLKIRPLLMKLGWHPPPRSTFWLGMIEATWVPTNRTRLAMYQRVNDDTNTSATARAYLDRITALMAK